MLFHFRVAAGKTNDEELGAAVAAVEHIIVVLADEGMHGAANGSTLGCSRLPGAVGAPGGVVDADADDRFGRSVIVFSAITLEGDADRVLDMPRPLLMV
jgi:hypothetical protein